MVGAGIRGSDMGRRKENGLELVASMPWPAGIVLGIVAYIGLRHGVGWYLSNSASPITQQIGQGFSNGALIPLAWMALVICWLGALLSYLASRKRARLLETQTGLDSLRAMHWREFEMLVGEAFRRQGYSVEETGLGGADGGIDLILRKNGRTELVQCKQWRREQINVSVVREMWGLVHHHRADAVKIVAVGEFTRDAVGFAQDKAIELVNGEKLLAVVRHSQATHAHSSR
jgi:restriction system protein